jgi:hypothetical protein
MLVRVRGKNGNFRFELQPEDDVSVLANKVSWLYLLRQRTSGLTLNWLGKDPRSQPRCRPIYTRPFQPTQRWRSSSVLDPGITRTARNIARICHGFVTRSP